MRAIAFALALMLTQSVLSARAEAPPTRLWVDSYNAPANHEDIGRFVAVDGVDRIYVAGTTYESGIGGAWHDYLLLQYDADGNLVWDRRYGGEGGEALTDLEIPAPGEVLITGYSPGLNGLEVATVKYDHLGNLVWDRRQSVQGFDSDHGPKLAIDGEGNALVSATDDGDFLVLKYTPDGTLLWSRHYDGPAGDLDMATDIAADEDGSIYVTGTANESHAFATVKFSPEGDFLWEQLEPGDIASVFAPSHVAVAPDHDIVVAGSPESACGVFQFKIWKCSANTGAVLWSDTAPADPCASITFRDMAVHWTGEIVAVCDGYIDGVDFHMHLFRYTGDGILLWAREFDGPGTSEDVAAAVAVDAAGAAYAFGYTTSPPQNRDYAAVKYSASGTPEWSVSWASDQGTNDIGHDIAVDPAGNVIVTGNSFDLAQNENAVTIKYHQASSADVGVGLASGAANRSLRLDLSPNPASQGTMIGYTLPKDGAARLEIVSPEGRRVRTVANGLHTAGRHTIRWDGTDAHGARLPSGIYLAHLTAGGSVISAKIHLLP